MPTVSPPFILHAATSDLLKLQPVTSQLWSKASNHFVYAKDRPATHGASTTSSPLLSRGPPLLMLSSCVRAFARAGPAPGVLSPLLSAWLAPSAHLRLHLDEISVRPPDHGPKIAATLFPSFPGPHSTCHQLTCWILYLCICGSSVCSIRTAAPRSQGLICFAHGCIFSTLDRVQATQRPVKTGVKE